MTCRRAFSYLGIRGYKQWLPTSAIFSSYLAETWTLIFRQTLSSVQRCLCSTALQGLLTLLLATASVEGSHHIFFICLVLLAILLSFLAHCWGRLCSLAQSLMSHHIFGIQFPVCLRVTDLSLHLMLIWAWQVIYFCCFELLSCHIYAISPSWVTACLLKIRHSSV